MENANLKMESHSLENDHELAAIYWGRGLDKGIRENEKRMVHRAAFFGKNE